MASADVPESALEQDFPFIRLFNEKVAAVIFCII